MEDILYWEGYYDYWGGHDLLDCPYTSEYSQAQWAYGWLEARRINLSF